MIVHVAVFAIGAMFGAGALLALMVLGGHMETPDGDEISAARAIEDRLRQQIRASEGAEAYQRGYAAGRQAERAELIGGITPHRGRAR